jgi:hypothetical protein
LALLAFANPASAQQPPREDGLGPYRFSMSVQEARNTAPNAPWAHERQRDLEILTGGPEVEIGGRMSTALVFVDGALTRLALVGVSPSACSDAVSSMVETLEPLYGAFRSMGPHALERGRLKSATRTQLGSEIRVIEGEDGALVSSARYGAMYVVAQGRAEAAGGGERCRVTVTFGPQSDWRRTDSGPGPAWAELDSSESLAEPVWTRRPASEDFTYDDTAKPPDRRVRRRAVLDCIVVDGGALDCRVAQEEPLDDGFGMAALQIAREFRVERGADGTSALGRRVRIPIRFNVR